MTKISTLNLFVNSLKLTCAWLLISFAVFDITNAHAMEQNASIARLNHAGYRHLSYCTASLITAHAALSAKHCIKPSQHLLFGYSKGEWIEHRLALKNYRHDTLDIAVICLNKKSKQAPLQISLLLPSDKLDNVSVFGYPRSKSHLLQKIDCKVQNRGTPTLLSCPLEQGMSGGPVMRIADGETQIVGIASATSATYSVVDLLTPWIKNITKKCVID